MPTLSPQVTPYYGGGQAVNPANVLLATGVPSTAAIENKLGTIEVDYVNGNAYILVQKAGGVATWYLMGGSSGGIAGLTPDTGTSPVVPALGVITIAGTAHQILTTGGTNVLTLSLIGPYAPATYTAHGVLVGEGTGSIVATTAGTNGQVLLGSTAADPAFGTLTTSTGVAFTTGAASLAINVKSGGFAVTAVAGASQALASQGTFIANDTAQTTFTLPATSAVGDIINVIGSALNTGGWKITYSTGQIIWGPAGSSTITTGNAATGSAAAQTASLVCVVANTTWVIFANSGTITLT